MSPQPGNTRLFSRGSWPETARIADILRKETIGGALLLAAAVLALVWANSPWPASYVALRGPGSGRRALHLHLTLGTWAADGLLAIFFFVAGLELKREFVAGDLRDPRRAAVPVAAAVGGVVVPGAALPRWSTSAATVTTRGWAIPTATDIAFALAVLAVVGRHLPRALRTFLLTLAVVDDLLAITIIAFFYTGACSSRRCCWRWCPLAAVHAARAAPRTVLVAAAPARRRHLGAGARVRGARHRRRRAARLRRARRPQRGSRRPGRRPGLAEHFEHRFRPLSAGFAVPVFAFFAAGVTVGGRRRPRRQPDRPRRAGHRRRAGRSASPSASSPRPGWSPASPAPTSTPTRAGSTSSALSVLAGIGFTVSAC